MANYIAGEQRDISGLGSIRRDAAKSNLRHVLIRAALIRPPSNRYLNYNYFPPKERIATLVFRKNKSVVRTEIMEYFDQTWEDYPDPGGQGLIATQCAYKGTLTSFARLVVALNLILIGVNNDIRDYTRLTPLWDEIVVKCYADAAIRIALFYLDYDTCGIDSGSSQVPAGFLPPPDLAPINTTIPISEPYNPDDTTEPWNPAPIDFIPEPPPPDACTGVNGNITWKFVFNTREFNRVIGGNAPARILVTNTTTSGNITFQSSRCNGAELLEEYAFSITVEATGAGTPFPSNIYDYVRCDNPGIPIVIQP